MSEPIKLSELSLGDRVVTVEDNDELSVLIEIAQAALSYVGFLQHRAPDVIKEARLLIRLHTALAKVQP